MIITGASGFLGGELETRARQLCPSVQVTVLLSPRRGGIDLADPNSARWLSADLRIADPADTALIHAAAAIRSTMNPSANETMATQLARWARSAGIGFSVMVSSVSVYTPLSVSTPVEASTQPVSGYGVDKLNAETVWQQELTAEKRAIVRLTKLVQNG